MRFLFLTTIYPAPGDSYMTGELAHELRGRGHDVEVLHLAWRAETGAATVVRDDTGVRVVDVAPRAATALGTLAYRASKFVLTSRHATAELRRHFDLSKFDAVVAWTPALTVRGPLLAAIRAGVRARILFVFDFFPIHHMEIGMVPRGPVFEIAKRLEEQLMRRFTSIVCNLPGNIGYLKRNYRLRPGQDVVSTPLWSEIGPPPQADRAATRARLGLPAGRPLALFGGQIVEGRGIEQMLEAAAEAERAGSDLGFLFMGSGRLASLVEGEAAKRSNVFYLPGVPREQYLEVVAACDVGLVATVPGVSSFSFPTKTIDYLRAGLPVVAAVEPGSDYLHILTNFDVGEGVEFGDSAGFFRAAERLASKRGPELSARAARCLDEVFHVRHTADTVLAAVERAGGRG
ncbi:glycosyltransferase family 4 protein [Tsuneonella sp. HG222]